MVTAESGRLTARGTELAWRGQIRFGAQTLGQFTVDGPVDLDMLDRHVMRSGFGIAGAAHFAGTLTVEGSRFRIDGRMQGENGRFDGTDIASFGGQLAWSADGLVLRRLDLSTLGGNATLEVSVPSGKGRLVKIAGPLADADAEGLLRAVFKYGPLAIGASATGELQLEWPKGKAREISGRMALDFAEKDDGRSPLTGHFDWRSDRGVQIVERADLRTPTTRLRAAGRIEADDRADLAVDVDSANLAAADELLLRVRRALGNAEAVPNRFSGAGSFAAAGRATIRAPRFEGRWSGRDVGYAGVVWGKAEWAGSIDEEAVRSQSLSLTRGDSELTLEGLLETGYFGGQDALDLRLRLRKWPAEDIVKAMSWDLQVSGAVTGTASVKGKRSEPEGRAEVTAEGGRYYGVSFDEVRLQSQWAGRVTRVTTGRAAIGGGVVEFRGTASEEGFYDGRAEVNDVEAGALLQALPEAARVGGRLQGRITLQGDARPAAPSRRAALGAGVRGRRGAGGAGGQPGGAGRRNGGGGGDLPLAARRSRPHRERRRRSPLPERPAARRSRHEPRSLPAPAAARSARRPGDHRHRPRGPPGPAARLEGPPRPDRSLRPAAPVSRLPVAQPGARSSGARGRDAQREGARPSPARGRTSTSKAPPPSFPRVRCPSPRAAPPTCAPCPPSPGASAAPERPGSPWP